MGWIGIVHVDADTYPYKQKNVNVKPTRRVRVSKHVAVGLG